MNHIDYCANFLNKGDLVLDVGSGKGKFLCGMAKLGFKVFGIEINPIYIQEAEQKAASEDVQISLIQGSAKHLSFQDNYFDFVNCSEVIEHVDDPIQVCKEIFRVLKPGGKCYISFHNRFGIYDYHYHLYFINWLPRAWAEFILNIFGKQKQDGEAGKQKLKTMHYFTFKQIKKFLENIGFSVKDIREEKIRNKFKYGALSFLALYFLLRPFYFNTFHLLILKNND